MRRGRLILQVLFAGLLAIRAEAAEEALDAFARGEYADAAALWQAEAEAGSAEAALRLGYLYDLGLGVPADHARAFGFYLEAAEAGIADAAFNAGVMLDSGIGMPRDVAAAATWYARAAARDHVRAQYNLGILYADGTGVPRNSDLARYWLDRVAIALPAANDRLAALEPSAPVWSAPTPVVGARVTREGDGFAELVWTAPAGVPGSIFEAQILPVDDRGRATGAVIDVATEGSAISVPLDDKATGHLWRVVRVDRENLRYAAAPWARLEADLPVADALGGQVRIEIDPGDGRARDMAERLSAAVADAGIGVAIAAAPDRPSRSTVVFAFDEDRPRASELAGFVPGLGDGSLRRDVERDMGPGEIVIQLVFEGSATEMDVDTSGGG